MGPSLAGRAMTIEAALALPDAARYELDDGILVDRYDPAPPVMNVDHVWVAGEVFAALRDYARANGGWAFPSGLPLNIWPDVAKIRRPDACYFDPDRFPEGKAPKAGSIAIVPEVVVLSISPADLAYDIDEALVDYLDAGVGAVWIVSSNRPQVTIFSSREGRTYRPGDVITGRPEMPGLSCEVSALFQALE